MSAETDHDPGEYTLGSPEVGGILGVHRSRVNKIPRADLPYYETPGGPLKGGRRKYRPEDVDAYRRKKAGSEDRIAAVEADVADLKRWREQHEQNHP